MFGGYLAWRRVTAIELTVAVTQEGQITERFTRAIQLLGDRENLEVRLGGIYALERIAKDSPKDHWTIMEVLTAYVREKSPWRGNPPQEEQEQPPKLATEIQAILTVLGRRAQISNEGEDQNLDLIGTDLRSAQLYKAHLERASLARAHLEGADLEGVKGLTKEQKKTAIIDDKTILPDYLRNS